MRYFEPDPAVTKEALDMASTKISLMGYFPSSNPSAQAMIIVELDAMCSTNEQVLWLAKHFTTAYKKWPGIGELRAFFCSCYKPLDGVHAYSETFPDGVPRELLGTPPGRPALSDGRAPLLLPPPRETAEEVTIDPALQELVTKMAKTATMPVIHRYTVAEIEAELYKKRAVATVERVPSPAGRITEADFEALKKP